MLGDTRASIISCNTQLVLHGPPALLDGGNSPAPASRLIVGTIEHRVRGLRCKFSRINGRKASRKSCVRRAFQRPRRIRPLKMPDRHPGANMRSANASNPKERFDERREALARSSETHARGVGTPGVPDLEVDPMAHIGRATTITGNIGTEAFS